MNVHCAAGKHLLSQLQEQQKPGGVIPDDGALFWYVLSSVHHVFVRMEACSDAVRTLKDDGLYYIQDSGVGSRVQAMDDAGSQFTTSYDGLAFYKANVLQKQEVKNILDISFVDGCRLGYYTRIKPDPGHIVQLRKGGLKADILCIFFCEKGSKLEYYAGSHLKTLTSYRSANRMWEVAEASLKDCEKKVAEFENGGWCILDARLAFERYGRPVVCGFASEEEVRTWPKLPRNKDRRLDDVVPQLQTERIGLYIEEADISVVESNTGD